MRSPAPIRAFSLIELLVTVAIIGVLLSLSVTSFQGFQGSRKVSSAGSRVMSLFEAARENAIIKGQPTAIVMLLKNENSRRVFAAVQYEPAGTWKQISRWEIIPEGVLVDSTQGRSELPVAFSKESSPTVSTDLPALTFRGKTYAPRTDYAYLIFMPDGSLYETGNCSVVLIEGDAPGGTVQRKGDGHNFFEILVNDVTGRVQASRL